MKKYSVTIIIPAFNEELLLKAAVEKTKKWADEHADHYEIIIVENGSTDTTAQISDMLANRYSEVKVIHLLEANIGKALKAGIKRASLEFVIFLDADWIETDFMTRSLELLEKNDIVVGSKMLDPRTDHRPYIRKSLSKLLTVFIQVVYNFKGSDSHGLNAFRTKSIQPIVEECQVLEIIKTELLLRAQRKGLKIAEVPVNITELRPPRLSVIKRCFIVARELWLLGGVLRDIRRQTSEAKNVARG